MIDIILNFLSAHTVLLLVAVFTLVSQVLSAVSAALTSIGDKVPTWISAPAGWANSVLNFLNGK